MRELDLAGWGKRIPGLLSKYRYVLLVILAGVLLFLLPGGEEKESVPTSGAGVTASLDTTAELEHKLEQALSQIEGAGEVTVVLTVEAGAKQIWAEDRKSEVDAQSRSEEESAVVLSRGSGTEEAVPVQQISPRFRGALVVCSGGGDPKVRLSLVEAVSALTGLGSDKISICNGK